MRTLLLTAAGLCFAAAPLRSQEKVNLLAYQLGVDNPEAPALVALGVGPPMRLGSSPRSASATALFASRGAGMVGAAAIDVSPYFLAGGGVRELRSYRGNSVGARLLRVLTKTVLSVGGARSEDDPEATTLAIAVRSTLHDPHDAVLNLSLPEDVAQAFARAGKAPPDPADESVTDHGVDVGPVFADARRVSRARGGNPMVSAGWGAQTRLAGGNLASDSVGNWRHVLWLTAQYPFGSRYDLIGTAEARDLFEEESRAVGGLALRRKGATIDYQLGVRYDARDQVLHPAFLADIRAATRFGLIAWIDSDADAGGVADDRPIRVGIALKWFTAADPLHP